MQVKRRKRRGRKPAQVVHGCRQLVSREMLGLSPATSATPVAYCQH